MVKEMNVSYLASYLLLTFCDHMLTWIKIKTSTRDIDFNRQIVIFLSQNNHFFGLDIKQEKYQYISRQSKSKNKWIYVNISMLW